METASSAAVSYVTNVDLYDLLKKKKEKIVEDSRLKNWSVWLKRRQEQYKRLCSNLNVEPECLVMNYEKNMSKILDTRLIEEAEKYSYQDKYRGSIHFWKTVKPHKECRKVKIDNLVYPANVKFKEDPQVLVKKGYVDTPAGIQEENFSKSCDFKTKRPWEKSELLRLKKEKLASKIDILEPFRPDITNLMVKGTAMFERDRKSSDISITNPEITVEEFDPESLPDQLEGTDRNPCYMNKAVLKIGSVLVHEHASVDDLPPDNQWNLTYTNAAVYDIHKQSVAFENLGPVAVHYSWEMEVSKNNFPIKYSKVGLPKFFFDERPGIILPGQQFFLEFIFRSTKPGFFKETWQLKTDPEICKPLTFVLQGIASPNPRIDLGPNWEDVENYIQKNVKENFAKKLIQECDYECKVDTFKTDYYHLFLEKEIFEYINENANFKSNVIDNLKKLREKVKTEKWDLSVKSVRSDIINLEKDCETRHNYLGEFNQTVSQLRKPPIEETVHNIKYDTVYSILSTFVSQIPKTANHLQKMYKLKPLPKIKPQSPKFDLSGSWENLRTIKLIQESSSDEEFLKDFGRDLTKKAGKRGSVKRGSVRRKSGKRGSTKRGSTKRGSTKRGSTKRQSTKRQSTKRQSTKRQSTKRQSTKRGGRRASAKRDTKAGRKSVKEGAAQKQGEKEAAAARLHRPPAVKPPNIKLTKDKQEDDVGLEWSPEADRDFYRSLLISHVKDHLDSAVNQIASALDSLNTAQIERIDPIHIAFPDEGLKQAVVPRKPDLTFETQNVPTTSTDKSEIKLSK